MKEEGNQEEILDRLDQVTTAPLPEVKLPVKKPEKPPVAKKVTESPFVKAAEEGELPPKVTSR